MGHLDSHHHMYETVRPFLDPYQMAKLIRRIQSSRLFELGEWSHIHLRDSDTCVGYLGDESACIVDSEGRPELKMPRRKLTRYFNSV
ncbi:MAG TPA: hypothetical protein VJB05_00595 [archaeon]|nr:hypothetical protein [archaeon]